MNGFRKDIGFATLKGESLAGLFETLKNIDNEATRESASLRGVRYVQCLKLLLESFKLVLDVMAPIVSLKPTTEK